MILPSKTSLLIALTDANLMKLMTFLQDNKFIDMEHHELQSNN